MIWSNHILLRPWKPTAADPFDAVKAAHLLNRAGFGATPDEIAKALEAGMEPTVDRLLDFPDKSFEEQDTAGGPDLSAIEGFPADFRALRQQFKGKSRQEKLELRKMLGKGNHAALLAIIQWWLDRMAGGPHPLQEKLTLFWHGHFTTSARDERSAQLMWDQNELLRRYAAGNFRAFVHAISHDPAMLDYLNNQQNRKAHPNENYARELMELFTLGIGHYTETDVKQAARAFTGWGHDGERFVFRKRQHDDGPKMFLGRNGRLDGDDVIDIILSQEACSCFIAAKLYRHFVIEKMDDSLVNAMGLALRQANYELRPFLRMLLTSVSFYAPTTLSAQIKSPVQLMIGTVRMSGIKMPPVRRMIGALKQMGQEPMAPPNVKGWPGGRAWISTSTLFARYNSAVALVARARLPRPTAAASPQSIAEQWVQRLIQRPIDPAKQQVLADSLDGSIRRAEAVRKMIQLIVSMPEYQLC